MRVIITKHKTTLRIMSPTEYQQYLHLQKCMVSLWQF
jgi:hypothetical protein